MWLPHARLYLSEPFVRYSETEGGDGYCVRDKILPIDCVQ